MPLMKCRKDNKPGFKWGPEGKCYTYDPKSQISKDNARNKALKQGKAIEISKGVFETSKISFDFDGVLTTKRGKELALRKIMDGYQVYIISARHNNYDILPIAKDLGILESRVYATGSNEAKIKKILELNIDTHYDNNLNVIDQLDSVGHKFESYNDYPKAASENACRAIKWAEENGWGDCGEATGKRRASQLCKRENISRDTIARMASFKRHQQHKEVKYDEGCGGLMWDAWGGDEGIEWAIRKLKQIDENNFEFKKWRSTPTSSNVNKIMYNDESEEMFIQFKDKSIYTYYNVSFDLFLNVSGGKATCITSGENRYGKWYVGKTPSVGASVHKYLVKAGIRYAKGGTLR